MIKSELEACACSKRESALIGDARMPAFHSSAYRYRQEMSI